MIGRVVRPRKVPHVAAVLDYLEEIGANEVVVSQKGHYHVSWAIHGKAMGMSLPCTPRGPDQCIKYSRSRIRRRCRDQGVQVAA